MSEIPDDVLRAARSAVAGYFAGHMAETAELIERGGWDDSPVVIGSMRAILAERERCATAAFNEEKTYGGSVSIEALLAYMRGRQDAAKDIRRGSGP